MALSDLARPDPLFSLVPWVVFLPLAGLVINLLAGKKLGDRGAGVVASLASGLAFVVSTALALALRQHPEAVTVPLPPSAFQAFTGQRPGGG